MGINIELQDESGRVIECLLDPENPLHKLLPRKDHSLLSGIDPYGDTVFNRLQMDDFLIELDELKKQQMTSKQILHIEGIKELAAKCRGDVHLYLKFVGD
jgi:hypothetical protein